MLRSFAIWILCFLLLVDAKPPIMDRSSSTLERLNRLLEKRQIHEYEADKSYRTLYAHGYNVWPTKVIAGHLRQLRNISYRENLKDLFLDTYYHHENNRMESFVKDVDEINRLTNNRLYQKYGTVKDRTFDDVISFLLSEIHRIKGATS